ncbi:MAG: hypothetical protein IJ946_00020 [Clostridia bacterium]|nr:hypothetical protein [Clostridia bacterium]
MKSIFTQTAEHSIANTAYPAYLNELPKLIYKHTDWDYSCVQTDRGYFLKPTFRNMPYRNSFVPEIDIVVSCNDTQTILHMIGQPVKSVRVFMAIWFGFALMMEVFLLALAITSNLDSLFPVFIPLIMCAFGYLLCKIATRTTFKSVIKAIQKELK